MTGEERIALWDIQGSEPANGGTRPYWSNVRTFVVARGAERAQALIRERHPDIHFHQIIRRNSTMTADELIVDPTLYQKVEES